MKYLKSFLIAGVLVLTSGLAVQARPTSPTLPLDSWIYPALDKLAGLGLVDSALQGLRPYTRLEAARLVAAADEQALERGMTPAVGNLLERLEKELRAPLTELGFFEGHAAASYLTPPRHPELRYIYQDGQPSAYPGTAARQLGLNDNNYGIDYDDGHNGQLVFSETARLANFFLVDVRPLVQYGEQSDTRLRLLEGKVALGLGPFEVSAGRQALWWGQGRHGALVLTNNARPLDMLRITNPAPVLLPWFLKYLGPLRFDVFWSRLEEDRVVPEPYYAGLKLAFKPLPWLELGAARTVMFGGEGRPDVGFSDFLTILGGKNLSGGADTSNSVAALDGRLRLPFLWGAELYGELGGEDEAHHFFSKTAWLAGAYLPQIEPSQRLALRVEYTDLTNPVWYRHSQYRSGYVYHGQLLGHHVGGNADDLFAELKALLPADLTASVSLDRERRGWDQPVREEHLEPGLELEWQALPTLTVSARYALDRVENFAYLAGNDRTFQWAEFALKGTW